MSKTIICIVGRTASGKDTFAGMLKEHGLKPVVSHTTRPIRATETNGVQHHFISEEEAAEILKDRNNIAAYTEINGYKYFTTIQSLMDANIYVIDPKGIEYLRSKHPEIDLKVVNIRCDRSVNQDHSNIRNDDKEVFKRRFEAESEQFDQFEEEEQYDLLIWNNGGLDELREQADKVADEYLNDVSRFIDSTFDAATKIAKAFLADVTDENGNAREDMIDCAWETKPDENGYYIRLYIDWEYDDPAPEDIKRLDTFVELRKREDVLETSSCYGYAEWDIANEIETVCSWRGLETEKCLNDISRFIDSTLDIGEEN